MTGLHFTIGSTEGVMLRSGRRPRLEARDAPVGACFETVLCADLLSMTPSVDPISDILGHAA